jgi:hypothetical protein
MGVHLTGMCLMGVYLYLMGVYLMGVYLMGVYLINVHLTGMHLMSVHLTGVHHVARSRQVCIYWLWKHCLLLSILLGTSKYLYTKENPVGREPVSCE